MPIWRIPVPLMTRLGATIIAALIVAVCVVGGGVGGAQAQITIPPLLPTSTTTVPGQPAPSTPPTTGTLVGNLLKPPTTPAPTTVPPISAVPAPTGSATALPGNLGGEGAAPTAEAGPFPNDLRAKMNSVRRSGPRSSDQLIDGLKELLDLGMPEPDAMRLAMGRFPIAGRAHWSDDWWYPRFGPGWRLHEGTDVFAARGTPVRSPASGTVKFSDGGLGGIAVYVTQADGTYFYLAHLDHRPPELKNGQQVVVGDVVGFVGTTGNASGGAPHLHFEVHPAIRIVTVGKGKKATTKAVSAPVRPGTVLAPINPKPLLDVYVQEALGQLPAIIQSSKANLPPPPTPAAEATEAVPAAVVLASHTSTGGFIVPDAPLVRTPLLGLAFVLMVMVLVLLPVLAPRQRLAPAGVAGGGTRPKRRRRSKKKGDEGSPALPDLPEGLLARAAAAAAAANAPAAPAPPPTVAFRGNGLHNEPIAGSRTNGDGNGNGKGGKEKGNRHKERRRRKEPTTGPDGQLVPAGQPDPPA